MENQAVGLQHILSEIAAFALNALPAVESESVRSKKDAADLVSNRDIVMESKIIETIHSVFPEHTVISEEIGTVGHEAADDVWLVDPIDGSCNDSHGIPWSCVSAAYLHCGEIIAGIIVHPSTKEVFKAFRGEGATLNGQPILVSGVRDLPGTVVMSELMNQTPWPGMGSFIDYLATKESTVRIMGSSALAITQVAAGRAAAAVLGEAGALDVAASLLISMEAGAVAIYDQNEPFRTMDRQRITRLVVAAPAVLDKVMDGLK